MRFVGLIFHPPIGKNGVFFKSSKIKKGLIPGPDVIQNIISISSTSGVSKRPFCPLNKFEEIHTLFPDHGIYQVRAFRPFNKTGKR